MVFTCLYPSPKRLKTLHDYPAFIRDFNKYISFVPFSVLKSCPKLGPQRTEWHPWPYGKHWTSEPVLFWTRNHRERESRNLFLHKLLTKSPLLSLHPCVNSLSLLVNFSNFSQKKSFPIVYPRTWPKKKMSWGMLGVGLLLKNWLFSGSTLVGGLVNSNFQWHPNYCWWNFMNSH